MLTTEQPEEPKFITECLHAVKIEDMIDKCKHKFNNDLLKECGTATIKRLSLNPSVREVEVEIVYHPDAKHIRLKENSPIVIKLVKDPLRPEDADNEIKVKGVIAKVRNFSDSTVVIIGLRSHKLELYKSALREGMKVNKLYKYIKFAAEAQKKALSMLKSVDPAIYSAVIRTVVKDYDKMTTEIDPVTQVKDDLMTRLLSGRPPDPSQKAAVCSALRNKISLVQGPPGTGKTSSAALLIVSIYKTLYPKAKILLCGPSNEAAENLALTMIEKLRVSPCKVGRLYALTVLDKQMKAKEIEIRNPDKIGSYDIVVTTCINCGCKAVQSVMFDLVLVDEATQANIPTTLVPIVRCGKHVVLIGDENQLEPVCGINPGDLDLVPAAVLGDTTMPRLKFYLEQSLYCYLLCNGTFLKYGDLCKIEHKMLNTNYRMHPDISAFPSLEFYGRGLQDHISTRARKVPRFWPSSAPTSIFIPVQGKDIRGANTSYSNLAEARVVLELVRMLLSNDTFRIMPSQIGVITPYNNQVDLIAAKAPKGVEVATVDSFQGREKDYIIISMTRANDEGEVGFVASRNRLNVSLTRAKRAQMIVGDILSLGAQSQLLWELTEWYRGWHARTC